MFGPCGFISRTTSRIMRPFRNNGSDPCCGSEVVSGGCIPSGVPMESAGAPIVAPAIPGAVTPPNVLPSDTPSNLEALPKAAPGPEPSGAIRRPTSATGGKFPSNYETLRPDTRSIRSRSDNLAHTLISTPVPAARSAQDSARGTAMQTAETDGGDSVLDHLPPLDLPGDASGRNVTPPVAPAAERKPQTPAPASDHLSGRSSGGSDQTGAGLSLPAPDAGPAPGGTPGIARFVAVDLKLAGGSAPSVSGLDWLAEKGYKTLVDLRESSETNVAFIAEATQRGLRYIALPANAKTIDRAQLARFNFELSLGDARPLYFFDTSGNRAGTLWYVRRITVDRVDSQIARREAEELGLSNQEYWLAATTYLERLEGPRPQVSNAAGASAPIDSEKTGKPAVQESQTPATRANPTIPGAAVDPAKKPAQTQATLVPASTASPPQGKPSPQVSQNPLPTVPDPPSAPPPPTASGPDDPTAWHPYAAMLITGLTFPLAYRSRSAISALVERSLASLPAPARRSRALPRALDA
jgi:protein tyrosine phosphatase (PTP) superfamily phosphohydrolase (DUF442 family)